MEHPIKMDDLGVPLFLQTPIFHHISALNLHGLPLLRSSTNTTCGWSPNLKSFERKSVGVSVLSCLKILEMICCFFCHWFAKLAILYIQQIPLHVFSHPRVFLESLSRSFGLSKLRKAWLLRIHLQFFAKKIGKHFEVCGYCNPDTCKHDLWLSSGLLGIFFHQKWRETLQTTTTAWRWYEAFSPGSSPEWAEDVNSLRVWSPQTRRWGWFDMGVSKNSGTPKSSILIKKGSPLLNHPFWGTPIFGNTHMMPDWCLDSGCC